MTADRLASLTWSEAEHGFHIGTLSTVEWEAYCRAYDFGCQCRTTLQALPFEVDDPDVAELARVVLDIAFERRAEPVRYAPYRNPYLSVRAV